MLVVGSRSQCRYVQYQTANFAAAIEKYTVSGTITSGGAGLSGVTVTLSGSETGTATTDANGVYSFTLPAKGSYTLKPSKKYYTFAPQSLTLTNLAGPATANFTGELIQYFIWGRIANSNNYPVVGVTITLSGTENATTTTNSEGRFTFTNLDAGGNYVVTPSLVHYAFTPSSHSFNDLSANKYAGFVATVARHTISGRVTKADGTPISGVNVKLTGTQSATTTTAANGNYSFTNLRSAGDYTVTLSLTGYSFNPSSKSFTKLAADQTANFAAAP